MGVLRGTSISLGFGRREPPGMAWNAFAARTVLQTYKHSACPRLLQGHRRGVGRDARALPQGSDRNRRGPAAPGAAMESEKKRRGGYCARGRPSIFMPGLMPFAANQPLLISSA